MAKLKKLLKPKVVPVGLVGTDTYENRLKIKSMIMELKQKFGDTLLIVSGGNKDGAEKYVKKFTLEQGIRYREYNPCHTAKNLYSAFDESWYNKPFHPYNLERRYKFLVWNCEYVVAFIDSTDTYKLADSMNRLAAKSKKPFVIINELA